MRYLSTINQLRYLSVINQLRYLSMINIANKYPRLTFAVHGMFQSPATSMYKQIIHLADGKPSILKKGIFGELSLGNYAETVNCNAIKSKQVQILYRPSVHQDVLIFFLR